MSIFFTEVSKDVQNVLNSRKRVYSRTDSRQESDFAWLYRKMAYVTALASNTKNKKSASLSIPSEGGIGEKSLYTSNSNAKFIPKPHINTFKTYSDGDFGSLQKCELSFTVYTLTDLDAYQPFFDLGADILVNYGWNAGGLAAGQPGKFEGIIYNFSYSVNNAGGFDCVTYGIAKGSFNLGINITAGVEISKITNDIIGGAVVSNTLLEDIQQLANQNVSYEGQIADNGIGNERIQFSLQDNLPASQIKAQINNAPARFYITLEKLVELINKNLLVSYFQKSQLDWEVEKNNIARIETNSTGGTTVGTTTTSTRSANTQNPTTGTITNTTTVLKPEDYVIICNGQYTRGLVPKETKDLVSANPLQMLFPGYATYGDVTYFKNAAAYNDAFKKGDISKILLNINWIKFLYNNLGSETQDRQKSADQSIAKFLSKIFNAILDNSGNRFKLSLTSDPNNDKRFVISDINYVDKKVTPYIVTAVNNQSICRNISLVSRVPTSMNAVAFIAGRSSSTTQSSVAGEVLNNLPSSPINRNSISELRKTLDVCIKDLQVTPASDASVNDKIMTASDKVRRLQLALKSVFEETTSSPGFLNLQLGIAPTNSIPFPIDFSATLDGIEGLKFGNTITTNYLPAVYKNTRVAFTITKIEHLIQNNDWITTVSTICRLLPDDQNKSTENNYVNEQTTINSEVSNVKVNESDEINKSLRSAGIYDERHNSDGTVTFSGFKG